MATRTLPGAYISLRDLSQLPEGRTSLTVGFVLKAKRGPVGEAQLVTSPSDFLSKYTFSGTPSISDDPTFWDILKVLRSTNEVYISRAANNPLYGGIVFNNPSDFPVELGTLKSVTKGTKTIVLNTKLTEAPVLGKKFEIAGTGKVDGIYTISTASIDSTGKLLTMTVSEEPARDYCALITSIKVKTCVENPVTVIESEAHPETREAGTDELFALFAKDPGAYSKKLKFDIVSSVDNPSEFTYYKGADLGTGVECKFDTMRLTIKNADTNEVLEEFTFSRDPQAKTIDGISLFIDNVLRASNYIKVYNNEKLIGSDENVFLPASQKNIACGEGSDGDEVTPETLVAALAAFEDKTVPISILGNGCSSEAESQIFQTALVELATNRKDCMVFLNSRAEDENNTIPSVRVDNIVKYKKGTGDEPGLGSTTFYATMYAPHVKTTDAYNSRQVNIGCDGVAIAGWLDVIDTLNYPYAFAGPQNGLVSGVTCEWKIGDESAEAAQLNDASINYIAFDGKVGRYYMQTQNTLQIANSAMRNVGTVLNVLDIKEHFATLLKEYLQLPITTSLRQDILNTATDYLDPMVGTRFLAYTFSDVTTNEDLADNTLRYLLVLSPTPYAQKIYLFMNIVNATYDFAILQSL